MRLCIKKIVLETVVEQLGDISGIINTWVPFVFRKGLFPGFGGSMKLRKSR
jgi:hypothetical protein